MRKVLEKNSGTTRNISGKVLKFHAVCTNIKNKLFRLSRRGGNLPLESHSCLDRVNMLEVTNF